MFKHHKSSIYLILIIDLVAMLIAIFTGIYLDESSAANTMISLSALSLFPIVWSIVSIALFNGKVRKNKPVSPNEVEKEILISDYNSPEKVSVTLLLSIKIKHSMKSVLLGLINALVALSVYLILIFS